MKRLSLIISLLLAVLVAPAGAQLMMRDFGRDVGSGITPGVIVAGSIDTLSKSAMPVATLTLDQINIQPTTAITLTLPNSGVQTITAGSNLSVTSTTGQPYIGMSIGFANGQWGGTFPYTYSPSIPEGTVLTACPAGCSGSGNYQFSKDITIYESSTIPLYGSGYNLAPHTTPKLTFNVSRKYYDNTGTQQTGSYTVYGTAPLRNPYPANLTNQETTVGSNMTTKVALSDDILPSDTVTLTALGNAYVDGTAPTSPVYSQPVTNLAITNNLTSSNSSEFMPIGQWITPANQRWGASSSFPVEFEVFSKFPRNNGQVAAVKFIASDGTHTVSHVATSMALSSFLYNATGTTTKGSNVVAMANTSHLFAPQLTTVPGDHVTLIPASATSAKVLALAEGSQPQITALSNNTSITVQQSSYVGYTGNGSGGGTQSNLTVTAINSGFSGPVVNQCLQGYVDGSAQPVCITAQSGRSVTSATSVTAGGSGFVGASGTMTYSGSVTCTTPPVLNVTASAGAIATVSSVGTAGACAAQIQPNDTGWTPGGGLSVGSGASFLLLMPGNGTGVYTLSGAPATPISTGTTIIDAAGSTGTVTVVKGDPVYDYQVTFTSGDQSSLNAGAVTIEAIAYTNSGTVVLDTKWGYGQQVVLTGCDTNATTTITCGGSASATLSGNSVSVATALAAMNQNNAANVFDHVTISGTGSTGFTGDEWLTTTPSSSTITVSFAGSGNSANGHTITVTGGIAAGVITPNIKNLAVYNDGGTYGASCAWVLSTGTATTTAAVYTGSGCATAPSGSTTNYFSSISAAVTQIASYNNSNYSRNNACGSTVFVSGNITGSGTTHATGTITGKTTGCQIAFITAADPALVAANTPPVITTSANNDYGNITWFQDLVITDNNIATNSIYGNDGNTLSARVTHLIWQNCVLAELATSAPQFSEFIGWGQFYNSILDMHLVFSHMNTPSGYAGGYDHFGSTILAKPTATNQMILYNAMGNVDYGEGPGTVPSGTYIQPWGVISAFNKYTFSAAIIGINMSFAALGANPQNTNNFAQVEDVVECLNSTNPCEEFPGGGYSNIPVYNILIQNVTVIGGRIDNVYSAEGAVTNIYTENFMYNLIPGTYAIKHDAMAQNDYGLVSGATWTGTNNTGCAGDGTTLTFPAPTAEATFGVTQTVVPASFTFSGGAVTGFSLSQNGVVPTSSNNGLGYTSGAAITTTAASFNDSGCPNATFTFASSQVTGVGSGLRVGNWRERYAYGYVGNVVGAVLGAGVLTGSCSGCWAGDYLGSFGNTATTTIGNVGQSFVNNASSTASSYITVSGGGGTAAGYGWYKPQCSIYTAVANRIPAGQAGFPADLDGVPWLNDGTDPAGAYAC